jgi:DeoR/GlpR family transcriptional regulator of sugar metabolism
MDVSDAWHHRALGKSAESVWKTLLAGGEMSIKELSDLTGRSNQTVSRVLDKLWMQGLVIPTGRGVWSAEPAGFENLQSIANFYQTIGASERRKAYHSQERALRASRIIREQKLRWEIKRNQEMFPPKNMIIDSSC